MITQLRYSWLPIMLTFASSVAHADIAVIVAPNSPLQKLSIRDVSDIYLGRLKKISGESLLVLDHPKESLLRERFYKQVNGMDLSRVNAYWARLQFSGEDLPPISMSNDRSTLDMIRRNHLAIGYVDALAVDESVRTLLMIKE